MTDCITRRRRTTPASGGGAEWRLTASLLAGALLLGAAGCADRDPVSPPEAPPVVAVPGGPITASAAVATTNPALDRLDQRALPLSNTIDRPRTGAGVWIYVVGGDGFYLSHNEFAGRLTAGPYHSAAGAYLGTSPGTCTNYSPGIFAASAAAGANLGVATGANIVAMGSSDTCNLPVGSGGINATIDSILAVRAANPSRPMVALMTMAVSGATATAITPKVQALVAAGVTVVAPATSTGLTNGVAPCSTAPAGISGVIAAAPSTTADARNTGVTADGCISLWSPGTPVTSALWFSPVHTHTFSSDQIVAALAATGHAAGAAALVLEQNPGYTPAQVKAALEASATVIPGLAGAGVTGRLLYLDPDWAAAATPPAPVAAMTATCTRRSCAVSGAGSTNTTGWAWRLMMGGQADVTATGSTATLVAPANGAATIRLTATGGGGSDSTTTAVTITDNAPSAMASGSCTGLACGFSSGGSSDDGSIVSRHWDFGDGASSTAAHPSHTYATGGTRTVTLTVTDDAGQTGTATTIVNPTAPPPVASASVSCTRRVCVVSSAGTQYATGYTWTLTVAGQSVAGSGATDTLMAPANGAAVARLIATNAAGADTATAGVTVSDARPVAGFTSTCTGLSCSFTSTSTDDGSVTGYAWTFGDGGTAATANPTRTYASAGMRTVRLIVTDDAGQADTTTATVSPVVTVNATAAVTCTRRSCAVTSAGTTGATSYAWRMTTSGSATVLTATGATATMNAPVNGTVTVRLIATGPGGVADTAVVTGTANDTAPVAALSASCTGLVCTLSGAGSSDDGGVVSFRFETGDGRVLAGPGSSVTVTYPSEAVRTARLTVTDGVGQTATITAAVRAAHPLAPVAVISCVQQVCTLDGGRSQGLPGSYSWTVTQNGAPVASLSGVRVTTARLAALPTTVTLVVSNAFDGTVSSAALPARVVDLPPVARITRSCTGLVCTFSSASSTDDWGIVGTSWDFGDGQRSNGRTVTVTYRARGTYTVRLSHTDDRAQSGMASSVVSVAP